LDGEDSSDDNDDTSESIAVSLKFVERRRIAEAALYDPSTFTPEKGFRRRVNFCKNIAVLCKRRERRRPRKYRSRDQPLLEVTEAQIISPKSEPEEKRKVPLKCEGFQYLFCLASGNLPLEDREYNYASKFSLQRHADRCRLNKFKMNEELPCPDDLMCNRVILKGKIHFKNHTARVYKFFL
jgi:hypothetical protein